VRRYFGTDGVRGIVGEALTPELVERLGRAAALWSGRGRVFIGRDTRESGPMLEDAFAAGVASVGGNAVLGGVLPTPAVALLSLDLGIVVSASHNPPEYNGIKFFDGAGQKLTDAAEEEIEALLDEPPRGERGAIDRIGVAADSYTEHVLDRFGSPLGGLTVAVDCANGAYSGIAPSAFERLGAEVLPLADKPDGTNINVGCGATDLGLLQERVVGAGADLGVAFDGDGDRLGVVTRNGDTIYPDRLLMLFASDVLERNPGAVIVYDVKCTGRLPGHILRHGGSPLMWKTGHSLIKAKMRETEAELAGEMSGHFFFAERWFGFDDGIYAAARLLEILAAHPESPTEQLNALPNGVSTPELKVDAPNGDPHAFVERFRAAAKFEGARNSTIDGLRVDWPDGWGLVRASNTTPVLVLRFDADSQVALARIQNAFREQLLAVDPDLKLPF
jgi:phosphomannomutase/phosphoglucomutase